MLPLFADLPTGLAAFRPAPNPHPYRLPPPMRWPVVRWTAQRVIVGVGDQLRAFDPAGLIAVADDAAWSALLGTYTAYQTALTTLAARLRVLGSYAGHLAAGERRHPGDHVEERSRGRLGDERDVVIALVRELRAGGPVLQIGLAIERARVRSRRAERLAAARTRAAGAARAAA